MKRRAYILKILDKHTDKHYYEYHENSMSHNIGINVEITLLAVKLITE